MGESSIKKINGPSSELEETKLLRPHRLSFFRAINSNKFDRLDRIGYEWQIENVFLAIDKFKKKNFQESISLSVICLRSLRRIRI